ncbi:MAG: DNA polymerase III subunit delta [Chloroflexi bacterium]|nr:DNA polymerase III subunit delta [Chloroflexota bacterium]
MLYIFTGQDDYSIAQTLDEIKRENSSASVFSSSAVTLDGREVKAEELANTCATAPFLAGKRVVIIKGLLERLEPRDNRAGRTKSPPSAQQQGERKAFAACLKNVPDNTILILVEEKLKNNSLLLKELTGKATVKSFPPLRDPSLRQWIQKRVKDEGGSISAQAIESLVRLIGGNLWVMASEIDKLVSFASGRRIEEKDVDMIVSESQQSGVFDMVDAIVDFKAEVAGKLAQQLLQRGAAPAYLLFMLVRQVRLVIRVKELSRLGKPETEMRERLGLQEFALRKTLGQAGRYSMSRLKEVYRQLLQADLWIKTGRYDGELALNILVAELCQRPAHYVSSGRS